VPGLKRRADLVFRKRRIAVYVDGCFWHVCPLHGNWPRTNASWWRAKLEGVARRDAETDHLLNQAGWTVLRIWEHEDPVEAAGRVMAEWIRRAGASADSRVVGTRPESQIRPDDADL
jgi:DNA mismatch endonuclease, patch repair protein